MFHLAFENIGPHYSVTSPNGKTIGHLHQLDDGFFYFFPEGLRGGAWDAWWMREIADKLDELNKPWVEQIEKDLGGEL
ncbi:MAG TPA: hypothetical protein PKJ19_08120 [Flavobacteriales bacterium]|nr:hypothetical protein [Flavobacteriales bacterium]